VVLAVIGLAPRVYRYAGVILIRAPFGQTGHESSRVIFGAAALSRMSQDRADELLPLLLEFGVNHLDTAAAYGDAELRLAPWLQDHRAEFFLATKTGDRTGAGARRSLERSLERLDVDQVDLIQLHNLVEPEEWETAHSPGGAVEALARARDEGLVRFIGVTGHGSVLLPYNFALLDDDGYRSDVERLLQRCHDRQVAVQAIKAVARRRWLDDSAPHFSWYEPLPDGEALGRAVRYVLAEPALFLVSSSDARLLRPTLQAASSPQPEPTPAELAADAERYQIRPLFDGAALDRI